MQSFQDLPPAPPPPEPPVALAASPKAATAAARRKILVRPIARYNSNTSSASSPPSPSLKKRDLCDAFDIVHEPPALRRQVASFWRPVGVPPQSYGNLHTQVTAYDSTDLIGDTELVKTAGFKTKSDELVDSGVQSSGDAALVTPPCYGKRSHEPLFFESNTDNTTKYCLGVYHPHQHGDSEMEVESLTKYPRKKTAVSGKNSVAITPSPHPMLDHPQVEDSLNFRTSNLSIEVASEEEDDAAPQLARFHQDSPLKKGTPTTRAGFSPPKTCNLAAVELEPVTIKKPHDPTTAYSTSTYGMVMAAATPTLPSSDGTNAVLTNTNDADTPKDWFGTKALSSKSLNSTDEGETAVPPNTSRRGSSGEKAGSQKTQRERHHRRFPGHQSLLSAFSGQRVRETTRKPRHRSGSPAA